MKLQWSSRKVTALTHSQQDTLDGVVRAFESVQAQGYFLHDARGRIAGKDDFIRIITTALNAAIPEARLRAVLKEPPR